MKNLLLLLLFSNSIYSVGQETLPPRDTTTMESHNVFVDELIMVGERDPEAQFLGGTQELLKYIHDEFNGKCVNTTDSIIVYSKVYLSFVVEADGSLTSVSVDRGINQQIDDCCVDFIKKMPKWIPATNGCGKPVAQRVRLPIIICLN